MSRNSTNLGRDHKWIAARRDKDYRESRPSGRSKPPGRLRKRATIRDQHLEGFSMRTTLARYGAALVACAGLGLATPALAQDKTVKIGVLNDMSSLYADIGGAHSVIAAKMAVQDSGLLNKGRESDGVSRDHQENAEIRTHTHTQRIRVRKGDNE